MAIPCRCDAVVIGGGPAGSLTATYLARAGYEVVLLEKHKHPRNVVGESLIPDFWKFCDDAGVSDRIAADGFVTKAGGTVDWHGTTRHIAFKDYGYTRPALHVERDRFDHILLEHARSQNVSVHEEVAVIKAEFGAPSGARARWRQLKAGDTGETTCRFIVDASGQSSVIARQLGLREIDRDFRFMSVWGYFQGSEYVAADGRHHPGSSLKTVPPTTYVTSVPGAGDWGWCWDIPLRERTSIGLVLPVDSVKIVKGRQTAWDEYFLQQCLALPRIKSLLANARLLAGSVSVIRDYSYRTTRVAGPGFFLVGDAAGFVDPIFSVGMVLAMYSARAAAWAMDRSFKTPERLPAHQAMYAAQLTSRIELSRALALPQREIEDKAIHGARHAMLFAGAQTLALMQAASALTARSRHFGVLRSESPSSPARA